jgi:hypothetical protein
MVLFSLYVNKASGARPLEASAQLVDLQKVFGGKIDPALLGTHQELQERRVRGA